MLTCEYCRLPRRRERSLFSTLVCACVRVCVHHMCGEKRLCKFALWHGGTYRTRCVLWRLAGWLARAGPAREVGGGRPVSQCVSVGVARGVGGVCGSSGASRVLRVV